MIDIHTLAKNQIEAKIVAKRFKIEKLKAELSMGLTAGITISETKQLIVGLQNDLNIFNYIKKQLTNER